ncbi:MAG: hypothetical protein KA271_01735 [Propionivibrio sp.]|nr:hypothetical protein [Propionivibrio sp.]
MASKTQAQKSRMLVVLVAPAPALGTDTLPHTPPVPCRLCLAPPQAIYILCSAFLTTFSAATSHNFPALNPGAAPATSSTFIASFTFITPSIVGAQRLLAWRWPFAEFRVHVFPARANARLDYYFVVSHPPVYLPVGFVPAESFALKIPSFSPYRKRRLC